jgi:hypothetical protein
MPSLSDYFEANKNDWEGMSHAALLAAGFGVCVVPESCTFAHAQETARDFVGYGHFMSSGPRTFYFESELEAIQFKLLL